MGHSHARSADAGNALEHLEDLSERAVLASQDVFLSHTPALRSQEMSPRHVGDVDQVETCVESGDHASQKIVEDHLAGRRGPDFPRADGIARIDDDHGQAASGVLLGDTLGEKLRALVGADHVVELDGCGLGAEATVAGQAERADARGVDHALDARPRARLEHGARAIHVVAVDLGRVLRPEPVVRCDVEDLRAALDRAGHGNGVEHVAAHHLDRAAFERPEAACRTREDSHAMALGDEQSRHVGPHETGGAGDQHIHGGRLRSSAYAPRRQETRSAS